GPAHGQNHLRLDQLELAVQERQARPDLVVLRQPVLRWPAFHDVADVHLIPRQLDGFEDLGQQLARPTDERPAGLVFRSSRPFADDHEPRRRRALARDGVRTPLAELALATGRDERRDVLEACRPLDRIVREQIAAGWIERNTGAWGWGLGARGWGFGARTRRRRSGSRGQPPGPRPKGESPNPHPATAAASGIRLREPGYR